MDIQSIAIDRIIPYWNNARNNSKAVKPVEESIKKYGFNQPLVLDKNFEIIVTRVRDKDCVKNRVKRAKIVRFTLC